MKLLAESIIDADVEGHFAYFPFAKDISSREHCHDFYEIFLIVQGRIYHHINDHMDLLSVGELVFIRPDDTHYFSQHSKYNCELLNIAFLEETAVSAFKFLGMDACEEQLLSSRLPSVASLTQGEKNYLVMQSQKWGRYLYRDKYSSRLVLRSLLAYIMSEYFFSKNDLSTGNMPEWLEVVCQKMQEKDNIIAGRPALMRLANRTAEYVGRTFKTYLGITPSQYINDLRLDFASHLLLHTNKSPTEVAYDVGFGNLSHFYHLFKARWQCSPNEFRKRHKQTLLP